MKNDWGLERGKQQEAAAAAGKKAREGGLQVGAGRCSNAERRPTLGNTRKEEAQKV